MNLKCICDSAKSDDYKELASKLPNNFIANLIYKIKLFLPTNTKNKGANKSNTYNVLGNSVTLEYKESTKNVAVYVNGVKAIASKFGKDTLYELVKGVVDAEVSGNIQVERPQNRPLSKDQVELGSSSLKKLGISISPRFSTMMKSNFGSAVKQGGQNRNVLSSKSFKFFEKQGKIDSSEYAKVGEYYIKKSTNIFVMKKDIDPGTSLDEALAREPGLLKFYDDNINGVKEGYILSKSGNLYKLRGDKMTKIDPK